ncbi:MAG: hypothetical protein QF599_03975 [Planctomycetota bacterium]|jgi:hypothetical protein|nr:hypothetical protein [Planctomycetota bacterium]MDP6520720.1 hypothetical protein [Planctomycetota bacterium]MDP6955111.1 hypothetical protein [Planctomycetota bacterium]
MSSQRSFESAMEKLQGTRRRLGEFLAVLDDDQREDGCLAEVWSRCQLPESTLYGLDAWSRGLEREQLDRLTRAIEDVARMNAIAAAAVEAEKQRLGDLLGRTRKSRRDLSFYLRDGEAGDTGRSCDLAG